MSLFKVALKHVKTFQTQYLKKIVILSEYQVK